MDKQLEEIIILARAGTITKFRAIVDLKKLFQEAVDQAMPEKKQGFDVITMTCKYCGDYDDCDCSGYNEAIDKIKSNLLKAIGPIKTKLAEQV
jgi:hypothetical protein